MKGHGPPASPSHRLRLSLQKIKSFKFFFSFSTSFRFFSIQLSLLAKVKPQAFSKIPHNGEHQSLRLWAPAYFLQ